MPMALATPISLRRSAANMTKIRKISKIAATIDSRPKREKTEVKMVPPTFAALTMVDLLSGSNRSNSLSCRNARSRSVASCGARSSPVSQSRTLFSASRVRNSSVTSGLSSSAGRVSTCAASASSPAALRMRPAIKGGGPCTESATLAIACPARLSKTVLTAGRRRMATTRSTAAGSMASTRRRWLTASVYTSPDWSSPRLETSTLLTLPPMKSSFCASSRGSMTTGSNAPIGPASSTMALTR